MNRMDGMGAACRDWVRSVGMKPEDEMDKQVYWTMRINGTMLVISGIVCAGIVLLQSSVVMALLTLPVWVAPGVLFIWRAKRIARLVAERRRAAGVKYRRNTAIVFAAAAVFGLALVCVAPLLVGENRGWMLVVGVFLLLMGSIVAGYNYIKMKKGM